MTLAGRSNIVPILGNGVLGEPPISATKSTIQPRQNGIQKKAQRERLARQVDAKLDAFCIWLPYYKG